MLSARRDIIRQQLFVEHSHNGVRVAVEIPRVAAIGVPVGFKLPALSYIKRL